MKNLENYGFVKNIASGQAQTWIAESDGELYVIKTLDLKRVGDWKGIELFEREVSTLKQLSHPCIPRFVDFFSTENDGGYKWHIVQEKVNGLTLSESSENGVLLKNDIENITRSVLTTLVYLQSFSPPLLHRDLKPANLIIDEDEPEKVWVVDFGSVRLVVPTVAGGSTIVGTGEYMAPEQLLGRAGTSSDLYALGMTLVHVITDTDPEELPRDKLKTQWAKFSKVEIDSTFAKFLDRLIEPHAEDRFSDAKEALAAFESLNLIALATANREMIVSTKSDSEYWIALGLSLVVLIGLLIMALV